MFEWLIDEMSRIKTAKFYSVDGPAAPELRDAIEESECLLPSSYREFVLRFGNARLYRRGSYYLVEVYAGPREAVSDAGEPLVHFGRTHTSLAYFKQSLLVRGGESPVFEWRDGGGLQRTSDEFSQWLAAKCKAARHRYNREEWEQIEKGPRPFSEQERAVVEARRLFRWRVLGVASNGDLRIEIRNGSNIVLPYLSVGVCGQLRPPRSGPLHGGAYLPVSSILPGETKVIEHDCYKQYVAPEDTEVIERPDPGPEDRELYWEFRPLPG